MWSPNGRRILYISFVDGVNSSIFVMNADGTHTVNLTGDGPAGNWPLWSPDGNRIAYMAVQDGVWGIYITNADGSNVFRLDDTESALPGLDWQP